MLAEHFVAEVRAPASGKPVRGLDAERRWPRWRGYAWPGNVRELENIIERALILARGTDDHRRRSRLPPPRRPGAGAPQPPRRPRPRRAPCDGGRPLAERLHEQERNEIVAAIDAAQGNIAHAARALGINRSTLYYRLRKHGLEHLLPMKDAPAPSDGDDARRSRVVIGTTP